MPPHRPSLGAISVAFAAGILLADHAGPFAHAPSVWLALALLLVLGFPRGRAVIVAGALLLGAGRQACDVRDPVRLPPGVAVDDGEPDDLLGRIEGPIDDLPQGRRFTLVLEPPARARVQVTARGEPRPPVLPGDRVAVRGGLRAGRGYRVPGALAMDRVLEARDVDLVLGAAAEDVEVIAPGRSAWRRPAAAQRALAVQVADRGGDPRGNAVVRAMVLGDLSGLDDTLQAEYRDAGVIHVLSISGLHLAVVALLVFAAARRLWAAIPPLALRVDAAAAAALIAAPSAIAYTAVAGAKVATLRALLVVLVVLAGHVLDRRARLTDALGAAALLLLALSPAQLWDASFQLSFAACATLALAMRPRPADEPRPRSRAVRLAAALWRRVRALLAGTFWATLATAPFTALHFGSVPTGGLVGNLVVVPVAELFVLPVALAGALLGTAWPDGGGALIDAAVAAAGWACDAAAHIAAAAPVLAVPPPGPLELVAAFALWLAAILAVRRLGARRLRRILAAAAIAVLAAGHLWRAELAPRLRTDLHVHFLDVGQGDGAVVELPGGAVWLIDGGGLPFVAGAADDAERTRVAAGPGEQAVLRFLRWRRIGRIDVLVITHPHPDHYAGLAALLGRIEVGELWVARGADTDAAPAYRALIAGFAAAGARVVHPPIGRPLPAAPGVTATVLAPDWAGDGMATADDLTDANDDSLVIRLDVAGRSLLFTGDAEEEEETELLRDPAALRADVIKVAHHGSRTSSLPALVDAVAPAWAIISCGRGNRFGLPDEEVVDRWRRAGARVLRTDRAGTITVTVTAGGDLRIATTE
jgi:competence protein ComEC